MTTVTLNVGDIVANANGHVMAVGQIVECNEAAPARFYCIYECAPTMGHWYRQEDLRFLSHGHGVAMRATDATRFAEQIKRRIEWAQNVKGLPRDYSSREDKPKKSKPKMNLNALIASMSKEDLMKMVNQLEKE
jgi:hypothetical protein